MASVPWYLVIYIVFMAVVLTLFAVFLFRMRAISLKRDDDGNLWALCDNCAKTIGEMDTMCLCRRCNAPLCSGRCLQKHQEGRSCRKDAA